MNFVAERRRPVATAHVASDRLTLPWHPLEDAHSRAALIVPWLAMATVLVLAVRPFAMPTGGAPPLEFAGLAASFVPPRLIVVASLVALPLLQLLAALALVRVTLRCLGFEGAAANIGLAIMPLLPLAVASFAPLRSLEAGWEALCALALLRLLVDRRFAGRNAVLAGLVSAVAAIVDRQGLLLGGAGCVCLALAYLYQGRASRLALYLGGLGLGIVAGTITGASPKAWLVTDAANITWIHGASLLFAAITAFGLACRRRPTSPIFRPLVLVLVALASVALPLLWFGTAASQALVPSHPLLVAGWPGGIAPGPNDSYHAAGMAGATGLLWLVAVVLRRADMHRSSNPEGWRSVAVLSGLMIILALVTHHAALFAQLLAIPLYALLMRDALRVASRFATAPVRVAAICLALVALTPTGGSVTGTLATSMAQGRVADLSGLEFPG